MKLELAPCTKEMFEELCLLLIPMAKEVALAPFHFQTASENGYRTLSEGMTFIVRDEVSKGVRPIIGSIGMVKAPLWYSVWPDHYMLSDSWFYVAPEHRGGKAGVMLLRAVRDLGGRLEVPTFVRIVNPNRRERLLRLV